MQNDEDSRIMNEVIELMYSVLKQTQQDIEFVCKKHEELYPKLKKDIYGILCKNKIPVELELSKSSDWENSVLNYSDFIKDLLLKHIKIDMSKDENSDSGETMYAARELFIELYEKIVNYKSIQTLLSKTNIESESPTKDNKLLPYFFQLGQHEAKLSNFDIYNLGKKLNASLGGKKSNKNKSYLQNEIKKIIPKELLFTIKDSKNILGVINYLISNEVEIIKKLKKIDEAFAFNNLIDQKQIIISYKSAKILLSYDPNTKTRNDQKLAFLYN